MVIFYLILPYWVLGPTASTNISPDPWSTVEPEIMKGLDIYSGAHVSGMDFLMLRLYPVIADSSTEISLHSVRRPSTLKIYPVSIFTMSPTNKSLTSSRVMTPLRRTLTNFF